MDAWGSLVALAMRQHGVLATRQAEDLGVPASTFLHRVRREGWERPLPAVWRLPGAGPGRLGTLAAASLAAGPDALVTGYDGLWLHGVDERHRGPARLVVPMDRHAVRHLPAETKVISSRTLRAADATRRRRLACATPARCFVDLVIPPTPPVGAVRVAVVAARQAGLVDLPDLQVAIDRTRGVPGLGVLRRAVRDVLDVDADSAFSDRVHRRLRAAGVRPDARPVAVPTARRTLHPDITFADARVCIECDGLLAHSGQRDLMVDNRKDRAYDGAGWRNFRLGHLEFWTGWEGFVDDLERCLRDRRSG